MTYHLHIRFEWDPRKEARNREKHGVGFEEAVELLESDADVLEIYDQEHSILEHRFISVGPTSAGILVVVWTERDNGRIRIISTRWASPAERRRYHQHREWRP